MNELAVTIGIVSFPGLIAALICDKLTVHTEAWGSLKYGIYTFVFGVLSYVMLQLVWSGLFQIDMHLPFLAHDQFALSTWGIITTHAQNVRISEVAWATLLSPLVALIASVIVNYKLINKLAQKLRVSSKYGDENLFSYFLNSPDIVWVYVRDIANNLTYQGSVYAFSETKEIQEIVLTDVSVYRYSDSAELYSIPSIYLSKPIGTFVIETVPDESSGGHNEKKRDQRGYDAESSQGRDDAHPEHTDTKAIQAPTGTSAKAQIIPSAI